MDPNELAENFTLVEVLELTGSPGRALEMAAGLVNNGEYEKAAKMYELFTESEDGPEVKAIAYKGLGFCQIKAKEFEKAIDSLEKARELTPDNKYVRNNLGWAYFKRGRFEDAQAEISEACNLDHSFPQPVHNLGWVYHNMNEQGKAIIAMERALEMKEVPRWHRDVAIIYEKSGNPRMAEFHRAKYKGSESEPDSTLEDDVMEVLREGK